MLRSLSTVTKEAALMALIGWRGRPKPRGLGSQIELLGGNARGLLDLLGIGKTL